MDKPSLYAQYLAEKTEDHILEIESGFATYRYLLDGACYLVDIYVTPEARKRYLATELADSISAKARERGCNRLVGTVVPSAKNSTDSLRVLLAYGMRLVSAGPDLIVFEKAL